MKKIVCFLLAVLFLLLSACAAPQAIPTPTPMQTPETIITPMPASTLPEEIGTEDSGLDDYRQAAEACRVTIDGDEYYLDTRKPIKLYGDWMPEYPLYRNNIYLGTIGSTFQYFKNYIYIKGDPQQEDYPEGEMTRVVDLETGTITPCGQDMEIFVPDEGDTVYYTFDTIGMIYKADASLKHIKEIKIEVPEQYKIEADYGDIEDLCTEITISNVKDGWVYFYYDVFVYEGEEIYAGNYRIRSDGTSLETVAELPEAPSSQEVQQYPTATEDDFLCYDLEDAIATADACRVQTEDSEYYLDTSLYMAFEFNAEFPLYRADNETGYTEYLGTTGYSFQLAGSYIYIKSESVSPDYADGAITRIINLEDGTITPLDRNLTIYIPKEGQFVYYTNVVDSSIFKADHSLEDVREYVIQIPEQATIAAKYADIGDFSEFETYIKITNVEDGWIYFSYWVGIYEMYEFYDGNYRIRTDGTGLEKTDEGEYYEA